MSDSFVVHIGGGAYLDASGNLIFGAPTGAQIYKAPEHLRLDVKKIGEVLKDLSDLLPHDKDGEKKWQDWGVSPNLIKAMGKMAGVVGIVTTTVAVYLWAVGALISIMDLLAPDDGMSPELGRALLSLKNQFQGLEQVARADQMIALHAEFDGRIDLVEGLLTRIVVESPRGAARAEIFAQMRRIVDELAVPLSRVRDQVWATTYDNDAYVGRAFASRLLVFEKSDGSLGSVPQQAPGLTVFDYRLGVPMLLYAATSFTALLQVAIPWFRSAGTHAAQLRKTADAIDRFVLRMQDEVLTRTEYTPLMVMQQQLMSITPPGLISQEHHPHYAVGAFDLVAYADSFLVGSWIAHFKAKEDTGPRGLFNYRWETPLGAEHLKEIADAANEQSRQDYATLQTVTGVLRLVSTAAWLRFLTTPPPQSQTVIGETTDSRRFLDEKATVAKSPIFPTGVVESDATLKRYDARSRARITTQEPGYVPAFPYRVILRTIRSDFSVNGAWRHRSYVGDIWIPSYEPAQGDPRCNRLRTEFRRDSILSEIVLYEGSSPSEMVSLRGSARLTATTFDWYVPVVSRSSRYVESVTNGSRAQLAVAGGKSGAAGTGAVSIHLLEEHPPVDLPQSVMRGPAPLADSVFVDPWGKGPPSLLDALSDVAERRHAGSEDVVVNWQLDWHGDKLEVKLSGREEDRPFQVHITVEETVYSGEVAAQDIGAIPSQPQFREHIHTPFVAEMVNQLVMVPEEFFTKERKALSDAAKLWKDFVRKFAKSVHVKPGDPIQFLHNSVSNLLARSPSTATLAAAINHQVEFAKREAPDTWKEVLRESGISTLLR